MRTDRDVAVVEHPRLVRDPVYLASCRPCLQSPTQPVVRLQVVHDDERECCAKESWETTLMRLLTPGL